MDINVFQWISGNSFFVTKWHSTQVERISTRPISIIVSCASLQVLKCSHFPFYYINLFYFYISVGRNRGPPRIRLGASGATKDHIGGILCSSGFSRISQIMKHLICKCFSPQFTTKLGAIDAESIPSNFPTIHIYQKLPICRPSGRYAF